MAEFKGNIKRTEKAEAQNKKTYTKLHFDKLSFNVFDEKMIEGINAGDDVKILYEEVIKDSIKYWNVKSVEKIDQVETINAGETKKDGIDDYALFKECVSAVQDAYGINAKDMPEIIQSVNCLYIQRCKR